jgi:vacuolar-type H+-ATPase subunit H
MENVINRVMEKAKSILTNANAEKEKIIEKASNDAEKLINENKTVKIKLEAAYKQLGEILIDLDAFSLKNED